MNTAEDISPAALELEQGPALSGLLAATHHTVLARRFALVITLFFTLGLAAATLMRLEMLSPRGWLMSSDTYHKLFSLHGMTMVYFVLLPAFPAILGLATLPRLLGRKEFLFPRLNRSAAYLFTIGGTLALLAALTGGSDAGWSFAAPYCFVSSQGAITLAAFGVFLAGLAYALLALNIMASVHARANYSDRWTELPLQVVGLYAGAFTTLVAAPALCLAMALVLLGRLTSFQLFDSALGGDPTFFNQLFWFFATPALYSIILPAAGSMSDLIPVYARRPLAARPWVARSLLAVAGLSLLLWGQHMLTSDASPARVALTVVLSHLVALPFVVMLASWVITSVRGARSTAPAYLFALVFVTLLIGGALTGLMLASPALNRHLHNTLFVVAHFHLLLVGGALAALLAALHHHWSDLMARPAPEGSARAAAALVCVGVLLTFLPLFALGTAGLPRRYHLYPDELQVWQVLSTAGAGILIVGVLMAVGGLVRSACTRAPAVNCRPGA